MNNQYLVYVNEVGRHADGTIEYDFYFSTDPDNVWGVDWAEQCPSACGDMEPEDVDITAKIRVVCDIPFGTAQKNSCFSMQDCKDGIIALAWEDIRDYKEYPEPYRIVMRFGEPYDKVAVKLESRGLDLPPIEDETEPDNEFFTEKADNDDIDDIDFDDPNDE